MNFVEHFNLLGLDVMQISCIKLSGAPTSSTEGAVGMLGMDITSESYDLYKCVSAENGEYVWESVGSTNRTIIGEEIDGLLNEEGWREFPDYILNNPIVFFQQPDGNHYDHAPFTTALIFTLPQMTLDSDEAILGSLTWTQLAISSTYGGNKGLIWVREVNEMDSLPEFRDWRQLLNLETNIQSDWNQTDETQPDYIKNKPSLDSLVSEITVDTEFNADSNNPIANSTVTNAVFKTSFFGWTDFSYDVETVEWDDTYELSDNRINGGGAKFTIHCKGKTLGFDYTCDNTSTSYLEVNGVQYTDGSRNIPLTYMETDVIVYCSIAMFEFSNMTQQSIKGVSELESQIGDIDTALDSILDIQNGLIGGDVI